MALTVALTVGVLTTPMSARADSPNLPNTLDLGYADDLGPGLTAFNASGTMTINMLFTEASTGASLIGVQLFVTDSNGATAFLQGSGINWPFLTTSNAIVDQISFVLHDWFGSSYLYTGLLFHNASYSDVYFDSSHGFSGGFIEVQDLLFNQINGPQIFNWAVAG
jgi:hypothetical protein